MSSVEDQTTAAQIPRIRLLLQQHSFAEALHASELLLAKDPEQRDVLLFAAISQRCLGRTAEALTLVDRLERSHPRFSRLYEERGNCFVAMKRAAPAIEAFLSAVNLNHALPNSWRMLAGLFRMTGRVQDASVAETHVTTLQKIPAEIVAATGLFVDGDWAIAESMVRTYLLTHGDHVEGMRLLARIGMKQKVWDDAEILFSALLELAPDYGAARREYAEVLLELHRYEAGLREIDRLRKDAPEDRFLKTLKGTALVGLGEHVQAISLYQDLLQDSAVDAELHLSIAHAQKTLGLRDAAIDSYRRAYACRPSFGDAYWSLANLKTYRFTSEEIAQMRALEVDPGIAEIDRYHLCFALGKALEDSGSFAESFRFYDRGNSLKRALSNYRPEIIETNTHLQIACCTAKFFAGRAAAGSPARDPIFIVGLPRSGSTLLEQILASHSEVQGTQELATIQQIVAHLRGRDHDPSDPRYPAILTQLQDSELLQLGERYLAETRIFRAQGPGTVKYFIDKMPNNFRHLGMIHLMLPHAKIIDARREPMACCFSNFKQLYANGQEFTYSIEWIARYYRTYLELMRHWDEALPGRVLRLHHEDVVSDLEGNVRRLLDFCELEFEPACIDFHKTERSVRTASSEQVRRPINREGLDQWKHFEPWLGPLRQALADAVENYRD